MSVIITGKTLDNKDFTISSSSISSIATTWKNKVKNNSLSVPDMLNVVYYGNFVILCPNYTFAKGKIVPGNGGFTQVKTGGGIIVKINVTSTEYPISIINNNYVVILSKTQYTPKIIDTDKIYLSKVSPVEEELYHCMYTQIGVKESDELITAKHDIIELSSIYDNSAYTIANICNNLGAINNRYSFDIHSGTSFTFYYGVTSKFDTFIPIIFTIGKKYKNVFTKDFLDFYFNYYSVNFGWWYSTFCQTIDLTTTADTVNIRRRTFFADGSKKDEQAVFNKSTTLNTMVPIYCNEEGEWPRRSVGQIVTLTCPTGYAGSRERKCGPNGWEEVKGSCIFVPQTCPADGEWPETKRYTPVTVSCPTGYRGERTRSCLDGTWGEIDSSQCILQCPANNKYPATDAGKKYSLECPAGYTGEITRTCGSTGVWGNEINNCKRIICPANNSFPETIAGEVARKVCPTGYTGEITRRCGQTGVWESIDSSRCLLIPVTEDEDVDIPVEYCNQDNDWEQTEVGKTLFLECPNGYTGYQSRSCLNGGIWSSINSNSCIINQQDSQQDSQQDIGQGGEQDAGQEGSEEDVEQGGEQDAGQGGEQDAGQGGEQDAGQEGGEEAGEEDVEQSENNQSENKNSIMIILLIIGIIVIIIVIFIFYKKSVGSNHSNGSSF
jgi:hypothetical protein